MAKKGTGLMIVWADIPAEMEEDFNNWYNEEHLAERSSVPGPERRTYGEPAAPAQALRA